MSIVDAYREIVPVELRTMEALADQESQLRQLCFGSFDRVQGGDNDVIPNLVMPYVALHVLDPNMIVMCAHDPKTIASNLIFNRNFQHEDTELQSVRAWLIANWIFRGAKISRMEFLKDPEFLEVMKQLWEIRETVAKDHPKHAGCSS